MEGIFAGEILTSLRAEGTYGTPEEEGIFASEILTSLRAEGTYGTPKVKGKCCR